MFDFFKRKPPLDPPTEKQIGYAKRLGIVVTPDMSKDAVSDEISKIELGPEMFAAKKKWEAIAATDGYILAIYSKGAETIVDVLRVNDVSIEGQKTKGLKLEVESPKRIKDKDIGDYLEWDRGFNLTIDKLLHSEVLPKDFYDSGIPGYQKVIDRGLKIAQKLKR